MTRYVHELDKQCAFPMPAGGGYDPEPGMTLREYAAIHLTAAWVNALGMRHKELGYTDSAAAIEAIRLAERQVDDLFNRLKETSTQEVTKCKT